MALLINAATATTCVLQPTALALHPPPTPFHYKQQVADVEQFMSIYNMQCPMAANRLKVGYPATKQHDVRLSHDGTASTAIAVAETVQHFITAMDSLKLNMVAVDQIYPLLSDLVTAMMKVGGWCRVGGWVGAGYGMLAGV